MDGYNSDSWVREEGTELVAVCFGLFINNNGIRETFGSSPSWEMGTGHGFMVCVCVCVCTQHVWNVLWVRSKRCLKVGKKTKLWCLINFSINIFFFLLRILISINIILSLNWNLLGFDRVECQFFFLLFCCFLTNYYFVVAVLGFHLPILILFRLIIYGFIHLKVVLIKIIYTTLLFFKLIQFFLDEISFTELNSFKFK